MPGEQVPQKPSATLCCSVHHEGRSTASAAYMSRLPKEEAWSRPNASGGGGGRLSSSSETRPTSPARMAAASTCASERAGWLCDAAAGTATQRAGCGGRAFFRCAAAHGGSACGSSHVAWVRGVLRLDDHDSVAHPRGKQATAGDGLGLDLA